jgi:hypothetical protein
MNAKHAVTISLAVGVAAIAGTVAATKTVHLGHPAAAAPVQSSSALIAQRTKALDRTEAALKKALNQRPPKLPPLPATVSAPVPAAGSPIAAPGAGAAAPVQQAAQRVVYVRPAPRIVTVHRAGGGHESEHEPEHESGGGGGFDD